LPQAALRRPLMRLRYDPGIAALMAAELARDNGQRLARVLGRQVTPAEVYIAHFLGLAQAARMIDAAAASPDTAAARLLPAAAESNPAMFHGTSAAQVVRAIEAYFRDQLPRFTPA
jgi:imidazolonepropionase-like amidohydrolase